jgi:phytanoyl-CoA hydroxylase
MVDDAGFLVLDNHASFEEIAKLRQRAQELVDGFNPETISVFSTRNQASKKSLTHEQGLWLL